jgi:hypothetical protein
LGYNTYICGNVTVKLSVELFYINKNLLSPKTEDRKVNQVWSWHQRQRGGHKERV